MAGYRGTIVVRHLYADTKSDGDYVFLIVDASVEYMLCRRDTPMANDSLFTQYENREVIVCGEATVDGFLIVDDITEASSQQAAGDAGNETTLDVIDNVTDNDEKDM